MITLTAAEIHLLKKLNSPVKIQDFLDTLAINFEPNGDTCRSPRVVLREQSAHCIEGALLAALALRFQGYRPLIIDLQANAYDYDHVVAVFKKNNYWGAISKTNHAVLRYREPIYKSIRELALSYFHEYFTNDGDKVLRSYTRPLDVSRFDKRGWMTSEENIWYIPAYLNSMPHIPILTPSQLRTLRQADTIEIEAGKLTDWQKDGTRRYP